MNTVFDYTNLKMGLVESCFAVIPKTDQPLWESRGFKAYPDYPIFLYEKNPAETIMLGIPQTLSSFGTEALLNSTVLDVCDHCGTYGMGGPGFLGLRLQTPSHGVRWLTFTVWCADQYILLNNKLLGCHPAYNAQYRPWAFNKAQEQLVGTRLIGLKLDKHELTLIFQNTAKQKQTIWAVKNSPQLAPMGNKEPRKDAYTAAFFSCVYAAFNGVLSNQSAYLMYVLMRLLRCPLDTCYRESAADIAARLG